MPQVNTAMHLALATSASPAQPVTSSANPNAVVMEGWVLKKRRKRMQGFARRYFVLHRSGLLLYSFEPGQPTRDQIHLGQAAISSSVGRRDIHIDAPNATFHMKCLSSDDFNTWMTAFRKFITQQETATIGRRSSVSKSVSRSIHHSRTGALLEDIGSTITELQNAFLQLSEEEARKKQSTVEKLKTEKDKAKEHAKEHSGAVLSLFKGKRSANHTITPPAPSVSESRSQDTINSTSSNDPAMLRLHTAIESLRHQHSALIKALSPASFESTLPASRGSPLATTNEEVPNSPSSEYGTIGRSTKRMSGFSSHSDSSVWFDAPEFDGPEEFVLDSSPGEEEPSTSSIDSSSIAQSDEDEDTDLESGSLEETHPTPSVSLSHKASSGIHITRRTQLPSPPVGDEGSLFSVLKKNVGKDLSQVALPVSFNEPLTLLQRTAEELEYYDLLTEAAKSSDPVERISLVAAFAISTYASTKYRSGRKGFNPMLAETFEDIRMKFIAEKVCHNPVVLAYHAEGENWELYATSSGKTKFWGKSLEIIPQGATHLKIGSDHYQWQRPSSFMRNLMMGTKYLEHSGKMVIHNLADDLQCVLEFKDGGYWGPSNVVTGVVLSALGETLSTLEGKWDEQMAQKLDSNHLRVLWRIHPFPKNAQEHYGFTYFGITLNEITPDIADKLPPTDSRYRPDVRALEEGDLDTAEREKARVEELQRERRRRGQEQNPRWFKQVGDEWVYAGGYWEQRERGWNGVDPLW
ncbi:hypothetical protein K474DRAFT_1688199 [Panus rudis PR-1116 ss-1]|nr:hypothetical protein K474DRAFT_1688199 [Panus rudis PR-1116 ss-1]